MRRFIRSAKVLSKEVLAMKRLHCTSGKVVFTLQQAESGISSIKQQFILSEGGETQENEDTK